MITRIAGLLLTIAAISFSAGAARAANAPGHGPEIDNRLVPLPPSGETVASAIWVIVIFLVMLAILYPTAWKNVLAGLKKREERIRGDIAAAEAARVKAEATLKEYSKQLSDAEAKVRQIIADGVAQAERVAADLKMKAQQEVEEGKTRATKEIDTARKAALADIYAQAAELSTSIASKILRRSINPADQQDLVRSSLEQLQEV